MLLSLTCCSNSCRAQSEAAPGCSEVSTSVDATLQMNLDPDRELQRIHSLVISNLDRLEGLVGM